MTTEQQYATTLAQLGQGIAAMNAGCQTASFAAIGLENIALVEQVGRVSREVDTLKRMAQQHRIDRAL